MAKNHRRSKANDSAGPAPTGDADPSRAAGPGPEGAADGDNSDAALSVGLAKLREGDKEAKVGIGARLRNNFVTGLVVVGPVTITLYIAWYVINIVDAWVKPYIPAIYNPDRYLPFAVPGLGLIFGFIGLTMIGALAANLLGRSIISAGEVMLGRMPLVRNVYRGTKQIFESVASASAPGQSAFQKVALMEFPSKGIWAIVFVTGEAPDEIADTHKDDELVSVFMPTHFLPPSGFVVFVPRRNVLPIDLTVEDAAKIIISAGMVNPGAQKKLKSLADAAKAGAPRPQLPGTLASRALGPLAIAICLAAAAPVLAQTTELAWQAHLQAANAALQASSFEKAVAEYSSALGDKSLPNDRRGAILNDRAVAHVRLKLYKAAFEDFNRGVQLYPEYAPLYNNRGNLLLALAQYAEAIKDFDRAVVLAPTYSAAYTNRGNALLKSGQADRAVADFSRAIEHNPKNVAALNGRGRAHMAAGRQHAAVRDLTRAVNLNASLAAGYRNRAEAKTQLDRPDESIEDLSRALAFAPGSIDTYLSRGDAYLATGNAISALKDYSRAIELDPQSPAAYTGRGFAAAKAGAFDDALNDISHAIELDPRAPRAYAVRAWIYRQTQQAELGARDVERALKLEPVQADAYWAQGEIDEAFGRTDTAAAAYSKALAVNPRHAETLGALTRLGLTPARDEIQIADAGLGKWRVVLAGDKYAARNDDHPGLSVPLEMLGKGAPKILEWERKKAPIQSIGVLRFSAGVLDSAQGPEELECVAVVDVAAVTVLGIELQRKGNKLANWAWDENRVTLASAEGLPGEFVFRQGSASREPATQTAAAVPSPSSQPRRSTAPQQDDQRDTPRPAAAKSPGTPGWVPWAQQSAQGGRDRDREAPRPRKQKSIFDMIFGN
jgi:uncharacterized membrane protein/Tfp pilus assembly protein PilF